MYGKMMFMLSQINHTNTVGNQTDETVKTVHHNLLLPLPTVLDWMRPFDPHTLVKPVNDDDDANEVELGDDEDSDVNDSD